MKPLFVLLIAFVLSALLIKWSTKQVDYQLAARIAMACMLVFTAVGHFVFTKGMTAMIPNFLPFKSQIAFLTGIFEIVFALGLLLPNYRYMTGWLIIAFFVLILPANIKAAIEYIDYQTGDLNGPGLSYLWLRIPMQFFFIIWVYMSTLKPSL
ncbi:MAG: hypothetical protein WBM83_12510 [Flavobacteriaceae bacterium]